MCLLCPSFRCCVVIPPLPIKPQPSNPPSPWPVGLFSITMCINLVLPPTSYREQKHQMEMIENTELIANRCATRNKRSYRTEEREGASHCGIRRQLVGAVDWSERSRGIRFEHLQRRSRSATTCRNGMAVINE